VAWYITMRVTGRLKFSFSYRGRAWRNIKKKGKYLEKPKPRGIGARRSPKDGACLEYMTVNARSVIVTPSTRDVTLAVTFTCDALTFMTSGLFNVKRRCYWKRTTQTVSGKSAKKCILTYEEVYIWEDYKGFWRWCMTLWNTGFLDVVHRPVL
jgi:hypothetical protein